MGFVNFFKYAQLAFKIATVVVPQIVHIEQLAQKVPALKGQAKEDAVIGLATAIIEDVDHDVPALSAIKDPEVEAAVRTFVQAYVGLSNITAAFVQKQQASSAPATPPAPPTA